MTNYINSTCDLDLNVQVPGSITEAVSLFGEANVLAAALKQTFYGAWNTSFRKAFCKAIEEKTGVARRQLTRGKDENGEPLGVFTTKKDGTKVPQLETEVSYLTHILVSGAVDQATYTSIGNEVASGIKFEIPDAERQSAPPKEFVQSAKVILARVENGVAGPDGSLTSEESFTSKFESFNPGVTLESLGGFTVEGIARALQIDTKRRLAEAADSLS